MVLGLGRSGIGASRLLRSQGHAVVVVESRRDDQLAAQASDLEAEGIAVRLDTPLTSAVFQGDLQHPAAVVVSPGIPWDHPVLKELRAREVPVQGELVPAWQALAAVPWIGITGTNGKTTVTHLVHHLLSASGLDAPLCGNVGFSAAELALQRRQSGARQPDWLVAEISSYQIEAAAEIAPRIGVWTTLTPDHLERHGTLEAYRAIKRSLLEHSELRILNADDPDLRSRASSWDRADWVTAGPRQAMPAGLDPLLWIEADQVWGRQGPLFAADALAMPGAHNRQNMLMAAAVGLHVGLAPSSLEAAFRTFPGVPHRLERIRCCRGITWYNDSKATNYDAAEVALQALPGPLVVLAGGQSKRGDASGWIRCLRQQAAAVILFGAAQQEFADLLAQGGYGGAVESAEGLEHAVPLAERLATRLGCQTVLLSPACASFDQYRDFEARGDHFRLLVHELGDAES
ncbi:MAG: UDP-N-acetylmuramoyl-L-alanine--D-glutamate ligase [Synechococcaceae cyanobacterium]|nr:UDP-N-acetylmuramoyl-L-alanine--D-glutamate ligase [Synechococcaceae cyanobacterium]